MNEAQVQVDLSGEPRIPGLAFFLICDFRHGIGVGCGKLPKGSATES